MTSGTRYASSWQFSCVQVKVISSMNGRWGSSDDWSVPVSSVSSAREPTHVRWLSSQRQIGSGVPQ
ncbi:hypothetical protein SCYAM73S_06914 [Streptomyces cyaneofuscatus]